ncbi:hypothetical protein BKA70DRAFT_1230587 [Coprinopsis sp. MPI-PUGE-AT-0042]|nr:hypothetical protein BKA70DRAFT_1230587 [Coprinopsis sp. MPI-PUGE-AT-0042]
MTRPDNGNHRTGLKRRSSALDGTLDPKAFILRRTSIRMAVSSKISAPRDPSSSSTEDTARLPAELIREVVTSLNGNGRIPALKRFALVSRQWNLEAKPLIFRDVIFHLENARNTQLKVERLEAILDSNPTLSSHVL